MKTIIIFAFLTASFILKAQETTSDTLRSPWKLDSAGRAAWENFDEAVQKWFDKTYSKQMKIKITCAGCSRFIFSLVFTVKDNGEIEILQQDGGSFCGKVLSEKRKTVFLNGFKNQKAPEYFKHRIIRYQLSRILKC